MKNSQLAILCAAVVGGSLIVAGTNIWLVRSLAARGRSRRRRARRNPASGR